MQAFHLEGVAIVDGFADLDNLLWFKYILLTYFSGPKIKHMDFTNNSIWHILDEGYQRLCSLTLTCFIQVVNLHFSLVSLKLFISK